MGSSSSRNVEASSQGSQHCRRSPVDASCFFGRRHHNSEAKNKRFPETRRDRTLDVGCSTSTTAGCSVGEEAAARPVSTSSQCRQGEIIADRGCCEASLTSSRTSNLDEVKSSTDVEEQVDLTRIKLQQDGQDEEAATSSCSESSSGECSSSASELEDEEANLSSEQQEQGCDHDHEHHDDEHDGGQEADQAAVSASAAASSGEDEEPGPLRTAESRRNSGRRFWDALTRAATHRRNTAPITIVAIEEIDDNDSSMSRWNFQHWRAAVDGGDHHHHHHDRHRELDDRRSNIRSHVWALQRLSGGLQVSRAHDRDCPAAAGRACSCEAAASNSDDSSTRASISRIIMLAEALFEVLDEIHRQSVALSQSATMAPSSLPAPDEVVDSFPVHLYRRISPHEEAPQCHICLVEYEDGDQMRVLPCQHEYHKACIDKWLKEVHRVCPLCRGDVCESDNNQINVTSTT